MHVRCCWHKVHRQLYSFLVVFSMKTGIGGVLGVFWSRFGLGLIKWGAGGAARMRVEH